MLTASLAIDIKRKNALDVQPQPIIEAYFKTSKNVRFYGALKWIVIISHLEKLTA